MLIGNSTAPSVSVASRWNFPQKKHNYAKLSEIRLAGKWLEACGFEVGRLIHVRPLNNTIAITLLDERLLDEKSRT
ncbi:SymE family type I addiction module toxin [Chryseolinea soli]|uniref:SymE family type I addiction module toxin n=1 Tax=Chryseolinea soli TaxID=2321403 RepID=UPI001359510D|nr:SymE family type I addiction module toxin [Chryseolinea soli]